MNVAIISLALGSISDNYSIPGDRQGRRIMDAQRSDEFALRGAELEVTTLLAEYQEMRKNISDNRALQNQLDQIVLVGIGAAISLLLVILERDPAALAAILLFSLVFFAIAFAQLRHERLLIVAANYVDSRLRKNLVNLLEALGRKAPQVLGYEAYLSHRSWAHTMMLEWLATTSRCSLSIFAGVGFVVSYLYLKIVIFGAEMQLHELLLLGINALFLAVDLLIAYLTAKVRFNYLFKEYYKADLKKAQRTGLRLRNFFPLKK